MTSFNLWGKMPVSHGSQYSDADLRSSVQAGSPAIIYNSKVS